MTIDTELDRLRQQVKDLTTQRQYETLKQTSIMVTPAERKICTAEFNTKSRRHIQSLRSDRSYQLKDFKNRNIASDPKLLNNSTTLFVGPLSL